MTGTLRFRRATPQDAPALARGVIEGVREYPDFAPAGWRAPGLADETRHLAAVLADPAVACVVAEDGDGIVGQITVMPARQAAHPVDDPALGHISNLFVDRSAWGTGLAGALARAAEAEAQARGFRELRLFVAEGQARARRFYEREGWTPRGEPWDDPVPGLRMLEYRIALTRAPGTA